MWVDKPRSGAPRKITDEQVESLVAHTLGQKPPCGDAHWSTRSMTDATGMSQSAVFRNWRAFGLKPHIVQIWKPSTDPEFVTKVRDVVGIYSSPRRMRWCRRWTRNRRSRPWIALSPCCRWHRPRRRG